MNARFPLFFLGAALALSPVARAAEPDLGKIPIARFVEPTFPLSLAFESLHEGYVEIALVIGSNGALLETFVTEYSHPAFATEVERVAKEWTFRPAPEGLPALPRRYFLRFNFRREGAVTVTSAIDAYMGRLRALMGTDSVQVCRLRELDRTPDLVSLVVPRYPPEMATQRTAGSAIVTFYIDETGTVRVAGVIESSRPEFAVAAWEAVRQWKFMPPTRRQIPVRVFAAQEFIFNPDLPTAEGRMREPVPGATPGGEAEPAPAGARPPQGK